MNIVENTHGTGALHAPKDIRDHKANRLVGMAPLPFLWSEGFDVTTKLPQPLPIENQYQSFACGGFALRYYMEVLNALKTGTLERLSAHDPYCQIFYPGGGTTIRDIGKIAVQKGIKTEAIVPSYLPNGTTNETFMEDRSLTNATPNAIRFAEFGFAFPETDMETIAQAIRDNNGCILQVTGRNNGTWLSTYPQTTPTGIKWSHFVYAVGALTLNGKKYIKILNEWGQAIGEQGYQYLNEDFFNGLVVNALVLYDQTLYSYSPTLVQQSPTWLQTFLNFFANYFSVSPSAT